MLRIVAVIFVVMSLSCSEDEMSTSDCSTRATIRDLSGLDGCGYVFELEDGRKLQPVMTLWCGNPPLPKEATEDPLFNFPIEDGKSVLISWEPARDRVSICMAAELVKITCISEATNPDIEP